MGDVETRIGELRRHRWLCRLTPTTSVELLKEIYYRNIFHDAAGAEGIVLPPLYPVRAAANYSLLYLILRCCCQLPVRRVLELGAGQSSLLLDAIARHRPLSVTTVEENADWANGIAALVSHSVIHAPLVERPVRGRTVRTYDLALAGMEKVDCLVVDGPCGTPRHSRWGMLEIADQLLADDFVVIFDDAARKGEEDTIKEFFRAVRPAAKAQIVIAKKAQLIAFSAGFARAAMF